MFRVQTGPVEIQLVRTGPVQIKNISHWNVKEKMWALIKLQTQLFISSLPLVDSVTTLKVIKVTRRSHKDKVYNLVLPVSFNIDTLCLTVDVFHIPFALRPVGHNCKHERGAIRTVVMVDGGDVYRLLVGAQAGVAAGQGGTVVI